MRWIVAVVAAASVACGGSDTSLQAFCDAWGTYTQQSQQGDRDADASDGHAHEDGGHAHEDGRQAGEHAHDVQVVLLANAPAELRDDVGLVVADEYRPHADAEAARQRIADYTSRNCG